LSLELLVILG